MAGTRGVNREWKDGKADIVEKNEEEKEEKEDHKLNSCRSNFNWIFLKEQQFISVSHIEIIDFKR